ncbi:hypothetical protein [Nonomuraea sp. JJY05]|uniref:hypothetical protein n=1 Tax=Nonomuraea sp. JJY05 TaxID=3350255 RepID=UPI00373E75A9
MTDHASPAAEIRAHIATFDQRAADAREATMTGRDNREWLPWYGVTHNVPNAKDTGKALVAHHRYTHDREEARYEAEFIAGPLDPRLATWIISTGPNLAGPIGALLGPIADLMEAHNATEQNVGPDPDVPLQLGVVVDGHGQVRLDWTGALALARRLATVPTKPPTCNGACTTGADLGLLEYAGWIANAHPDCPLHA